MADSMNKILQAVNLLQQAALGLPAGQRLHTDCLQAAQRLSKHIGGGGMGPAAGIQKTSLTDQLRDTVRNMMLQRIMQAQRPPGAGADRQPAGPSALAGPPMPSTPLPGA
jgi:hypothetical protein